MNLFSNTSECTQYSAKWKSAVDSSLSAVESSFSEADWAIADARASYSLLEFSGVCKSDYSGPGSESCPELAIAFASVDNDLSEGDYGKYSEAKLLAANLENELKTPAPDLSMARTILGMIWTDGGVIKSFHALRDKSLDAKKQADAEFQEKYDESSSKKIRLDKAISDFSLQKPSLIERAPSGLELDVGSIGTRFSVLRKKASELSLMVGESRLLFTRTTRQNYLSGALLNITGASESYDELFGDLADLQEDSERTVADQKSEAEEEIRKTSDFASAGTPAPAALSYLESAKASYEGGKSADSLGEMFVFYSRAAALARAARSQDMETEIRSAANLSELEDLISRAETDGINVAAEKESLRLVSKLPAELSEQKLRELIAVIESKARIKYNAILAEKRKSIVEKIALAGQDAADLSSELNRFERGLVEDGNVLFPGAVGSLAVLSSNYDSLDKTLDSYMKEITGGSMSASAISIIPEAKLDSPSEILVDAVLTNGRQYASQNVPVRVSLDRPLQLMLSDIVSGKEDVQSVRSAEGGKVVIITFSQVGSFETKHITFRKNLTIARTLSDTVVAEGNGDGSASVRRKIEFELDTDAGMITLPRELSNPLIDGSQPGKLSPGRHTLISEYRLDNAYSESIHNVRAYSLGANSQVEYEIKITPEIDLGKVPIYVNSLNSSNIASMDIVSVTGETLKNERRLSETQFGAEILNLKKSKTAAVRVSYLVENSKEFVENELASLSSLNLSDNARSSLAQAESDYQSGNFAEAIEALEKTKHILEDENRQSQKSKAEFFGLSGTLESEISYIEGALAGTTLNATFVQKLSSRKDELRNALALANGSDISKLEKVDANWLGKELTSLKKDLYKQYNDLKERFYRAGNASTPEDFLDFEQKLSVFESGNRLDSAISALESIGEVKKAVEAAEEAANAERGLRRAAFASSKSALLESWDEYSRQASAAKGTDYSSLFTETERKINSIIADTEDSLDSDPRLFSQKLSEMNQTEERLQDVVDSLRQQAFSRLSLLRAAMEKDGRSDLLAKLAPLESMAEGGDYVNALRSAASLSKELGTKETSDDGLLILGITALAAIAAGGYYVMHKPKKNLRFLQRGESKPPHSAPEKF
ncbi:MAG TPA: hypothetical protein VLD37_02415 [Candidatus Bilamarchaeum sp.]|nr:hypothetical protein [Candidatus Bilamarchaeum sp.]